MAIYKLIIQGTLPSLNTYVDVNRANKRKGSNLKQYTDDGIMWQLKTQLNGIKLKPPVHIDYLWVEHDRHRDLDNIAFGKKFIQDALVKLGALANDGWKYISGFTDRFATDVKNPRIEITVYDGEDKRQMDMEARNESTTM